MTSPFDIVKSLNSKVDIEFEMSAYKAFVINKALSFHKDTIMHANEMNEFSFLDDDMQYRFYREGIPKGNRYGKWMRADDPSGVVELLKKRYRINNQLALAYSKLLSENDIQQLYDSNAEGGKYGHDPRNRNSS